MKNFIPSVFLAMFCIAQATVIPFVIYSSPVVIRLLGLDFAILLNMNVVIGLEGANFVVGEFDPRNQSARYKTSPEIWMRT
jgi:hypothetical protein